MSATAVEFAPGLEGVIAARTQLSKVENIGRLSYLGYSIEDLAAGKATFEETCFLLWHKRLPSKSELAELTKTLNARMKLDAKLIDLIKLMPKKAHPMEALRTAASFLGTYEEKPLETNDVDHAITLTAKLGAIVAAHHRIRNFQDPVEPSADLGLGANFLYMLHGRKPSPEHAEALDVSILMHADHGFNASTFAAMVTASTLEGLYGAVTTGIATLAGPRHGGANEACLDQIDLIGSEDNAAKWLEDTLAAKGKIYGYGHRVYKAIDPRAKIFREYAKTLSAGKDTERLYKINAALEAAIDARRDAGKFKDTIWPNVDFYSGVVYQELGIPRDLFTPLFAVSRVSGWTAHVLEYLAPERKEGRLFRPKALYDGPTPPVEYVPVDKR